jgi:hypothetical protein
MRSNWMIVDSKVTEPYCRDIFPEGLRKNIESSRCKFGILTEVCRSVSQPSQTSAGVVLPRSNP